MSRADGPTGLGDLLSGLVVSRSWQSRLRLHQVFTFWNDVVGPDIARHAQPQVIRGAVLWVGVSDAIWMQQLQFERQYLLEAINARLRVAQSGLNAQSTREQNGDVCLTELRLTLDLSLANQQNMISRTPPPNPTVDQEELAKFTAMLSSITDLDLKQSMIRVWLAMHRGNQQRARSVL